MAELFFNLNRSNWRMYISDRAETLTTRKLYFEVQFVKRSELSLKCYWLRDVAMAKLSWEMSPTYEHSGSTDPYLKRKRRQII